MLQDSDLIVDYMSDIQIAIFGPGNTAKNIGLTTMYNLHQLDKDVEIAFLDIKPERKKARLLAKELKDSGRKLGIEFSFFFRPENIPNPDIAIITTGRQRKQGERREKMFNDNSKPIQEIITEYCPKNNISLKNSIIVDVVNPCILSSYINGLMKGVYGKSAKAGNIVASGTGLDLLRTEGTIHDFIENNLELSRNSSNRFVDVNVGGGHDETMVFALDHATVGGNPIRGALGEKNVAGICEEVRRMGAEYNANLDGAGPSVGADVFYNLIRPVVNNSHEKVPALAPVRIDNEYDMSRLGLKRNNILEYVSELESKNSNIIKAECFEEILPHISRIWTGLLPKVGKEGVMELNIPKYSEPEKRKFEYSIANTIVETVIGYHETGVLRPHLDYEIKKHVFPCEKISA